MKISFEKTSIERKKRIGKQINKESKISEVAIEKIKRSTDLDKFKEDKAKSNLLSLRNLSSEELEKNRVGDLLLTTKSIRNELEKDNNVNNPIKYNLSQNYPNPFNPTTTISYDIQNDGIVTIKIYDILGKEVKVLVNEFRQAGSYQINFDGYNLSSGIYFYKLETGNFVQTKRMALIK